MPQRSAGTETLRNHIESISVRAAVTRHFVVASTPRVHCLSSSRKKVIHLKTPLQLLKAKRSSALIDARKMEAQLARLNQSAETTGITTNGRWIVQMFREYIATLDEAIKSAHTPRTRRNVRRLS